MVDIPSYQRKVRDMKITISVVENGYILFSGGTTRLVEKQDNDIKHDAEKYLLYEILEMIGEGGSKHDEYRLRIIQAYQGDEDDKYKPKKEYDCWLCPHCEEPLTMQGEI